MSGGEVTPAALEWEAELELGDGIGGRLRNGTYRIRYRPNGAGTWRSFWLEAPGGSPPTEALVLSAIAEHAASMPSSPRRASGG